jgi:hypothetical protein
MITWPKVTRCSVAMSASPKAMIATGHHWPTVSSQARTPVTSRTPNRPRVRRQQSQPDASRFHGVPSAPRTLL